MRLLLSEGQQNDHKGAAALLSHLPKAKVMIADRGYDSDPFREGLRDQGIEPCIPPRANRIQPASYCKILYKQRHKIENLFAKFKDWQRIAMRYDRCAHTFQSAIYLAATLIFYINQ